MAFTYRHVATRNSGVRLFDKAAPQACQAANRQSRRRFTVSASRHTDGVFRALTDARIAIPWITALQQRDAGEQQHVDDKAPVERDLSPKKMNDSYHSVILPLAQDKWMSDTYVNSSGNIRLGTLFMDLDALSGIVAYKHTGPGVMTVTAALDRIAIERPLTEICDLEYSGRVTYASGRSSMEVTCQVSKAPKSGQKASKDDVLLTFTTTMVSLDPETKKPVNIPSLELENDEERAIFKLGESRSIAKKKLAKQSLLTSTPDPSETSVIHNIWLKQLAYHDPGNPLRMPDNVTPMAKTSLQTASIMQPQYRNRHNFMIFGGFLLKQTFELAFCCAASFSHTRPSFISADPCNFLNPVPVGSVLYLTATVVYTDPPLVEASSDTDKAPSKGGRPLTRVQVRVDSKVRDVEHGHAKPTGQFHYTFTVERDVKIIPQTYQEFMIYTDARRRVQRVSETVTDDISEALTDQRRNVFE